MSSCLGGDLAGFDFDWAVIGKSICAWNLTVPVLLLSTFPTTLVGLHVCHLYH